MDSVIPLIILQLVCCALGHDRVAPGVPPQHYANQGQGQYNQHMHQQPGQHQQQMHQPPPPPQQNYQQQQQMPPQHQQQIPQQQMQQQQQQIPHQQQQQQHHAHGNINQGDMLNAANIHQEKDHLKEHLHAQVDTSKMTEQELQFHYFKMHDSDNNNKLDGCELIKSLIHWHDTTVDADHQDAPPQRISTDEELAAAVDPLFRDYDSDADGFIDYTEFKNYQSQQRT